MPSHSTTYSFLGSDKPLKTTHAAAKEEANLSSPYTLATLVKLLLDSPEHVWRAIEQDDFLSAARLEGLGRVVYRELVAAKNDPEEDEDAASEILVRRFESSYDMSWLTLV